MGYTKETLMDCGYFYCPYVALTSTPIIDLKKIFRKDEELVRTPGMTDDQWEAAYTEFTKKKYELEN